MKAKEFWPEFARGSALGLGMIPGVSAGTMAIIVGIYDKLIGSLTGLRKDFKHSWHILWPLLIGIVLSCIIVLIGVSYGYKEIPFILAATFAGLVIGTLPIITKELKGQTIGAKGIVLIVIGFVVAAAIGVLNALSKIYWGLDFNDAFIAGNVWWTYLACVAVGFIAAVACVIPGISGSMIIFIFGLYNPCIGIYIGKDSMFHNHARIGSGLLLTLCVVIGAVIGLIVAAKGMKKLLATKKLPTFEVVLGFILGSVVSIFVNSDMVKTDKTWIYSSTPWWMYLIGAVMFVLMVIALGYISKKSIAKSAEKTPEN